MTSVVEHLDHFLLILHLRQIDSIGKRPTSPLGHSTLLPVAGWVGRTYSMYCNDNFATCYNGKLKRTFKLLHRLQHAIAGGCRRSNSSLQTWSRRKRRIRWAITIVMISMVSTAVTLFSAFSMDTLWNSFPLILHTTRPLCKADDRFIQIEDLHGIAASNTNIHFIETSHTLHKQ